MSWEIEPIFDREYLEQYKDLDQPGEPGIAFQMIEKFLENADGRLGRLRSAVEQSKEEEIRNYAHAIKSSCGTVGAKRVYVISAMIEDCGQHHTLGEVPRLFGALVKEFELLQGELSTYLKSQ